MDRRFLAILAGLVIVFGGIFIFNQNSNNSSSGGSGKGDSSKATSHVQGEGQKNITIVEYGDYQCPVCGVYYSPVKQVEEKYNKEVRFQFRNLPLVTLHPNAFAAARAAEAAGFQNKYFEMHDKLYENQNAWSDSNSPIKIFQAYAKEIGLNMTQYNSDYSSGKVNDAINADVDAFKKTGEQMATPTFFINGKHIDNSDLTDPKTGAPSVEQFSAIIDAEIAKQGAKKTQWA